MSGAEQGAPVLHGQEASLATSRMFPLLPPSDPGAVAIERLARAMIESTEASRNNRRIPAGYTYLGQFIDHDITADPTPSPEPPAAPRTPRLDLDSLYGAGPAGQPALYDADDEQHPGVRLLVIGDDVPRAGARALIGDARNDENLIVLQLHVLFLRFHNAVVEHLRRGAPPAPELFEEAQRLVRWHYQWIVVHDFLETVAGGNAVLSEPRLFAPGDELSLPIEFSAAAFRFAHSMVRSEYNLDGTGATPTFLAPGVRGNHLGGNRPLPEGMRIKWERFFAVPDGSAPTELSLHIDTRISAPLNFLPPDGSRALTRLDLERGREKGLPAGGDVADAARVPRMSEEQLGLHTLIGDDPDAVGALTRATPLWYYILREAAVLGADGQPLGDGAVGRRLGPLGGRIVAEVLWGLLEGDPSSYLRQQPDWTPTLPRHKAATFTMGDLVKFTEPPL